MKNNKSNKHRGAMFIEYALIFALLVAVGFVFVGDKGFGNGITSIITKTEEMLGLATSEDEPKSKNLLEGIKGQIGSWQSTSGKVWGSDTRASLDSLVELEPNTTYVYTLDTSDYSDFKVGILLFNSERNNSEAYDPKWMTLKTQKNVKGYNVDTDYTNNTYTVTFTTTDKDINFTSNFMKTDGSTFSDEERSKINNIISTATLVKQ